MTTLSRPWSPGDPLPAGATVIGGIDPAAGHSAGDGARAGVPPSPARVLSSYQRGYLDARRHAAAQLVPLIAACLAQLQICRRLRNSAGREDPTDRTYDLLADVYRGEAKRLLNLRRALQEDPYR